MNDNIDADDFLPQCLSRYRNCPDLVTRIFWLQITEKIFEGNWFILLFKSIKETAIANPKLRDRGIT